MSFLSLYVEVFVWPAVILLGLLCLPCNPRPIKKALAWITKHLLFARVNIGNTSFPVFAVINVLAFVMLVVASHDMQRHYMDPREASYAQHSDQMHVKYLKSQVRFWIALATFLFYMAVTRIHYLHEKVFKLQDDSAKKAN